MLRHRERQPQQSSPSQQQAASHSDSSYEALTEWYRQCRNNYFHIDFGQLHESYNAKHACYRMAVVWLVYGKTELTQLDDGEYEIEAFANFCEDRTKLVAAPYQSQRISCLYKNRTFMLKEPLLLYYHGLKYRDVMLFLEFQLVASAISNEQFTKTRLGYCEINPYEERTTETAASLMRGWPLDTKVKPVVIGSCYYTLEVGVKGLQNIKLLIPPLTIVDALAKVPCCKGNRLPNEKKPVELEPTTSLQIGMLKVEAPNLLKIGRELAQRFAVKSTLEGSLKASTLEFLLRVGYHNTWTMVGNPISVQLKPDESSEWLENQGEPFDLSVSNLKSACVLAILTCRWKSTEPSQIKHMQPATSTVPLCWFVLPLELHRDVSMLSVSSMTSPLENMLHFECSAPIKLSCRIKHANFASYRHLRENAVSIHEQAVIPDLWTTVADTLRHTSEWKTFLRSEKQNSLDDVHFENQELIKKQKRIERLLNKKLFRPKLTAGGLNCLMEPVAEAELEIDKDRLRGTKLIASLRLKSFVPYYRRLKDTQTSSNYHFVPRLMSVRTFVLDSEQQSSTLELSDEVKFGVPCLLTKLEFRSGGSLHSHQTISVEIPLTDDTSIQRLLSNHMHFVVFDAESHIVYGLGRTSLRSLLQLGKPIRLRVELYDITAAEVRGGLCLDGTSHLQQLNKNRTVSKTPLPSSIVAMQLPQQSRLESRIKAYKASQGRGTLVSANEEAQLDLIRKYKEDNAKRFVRKAVQKAGFDEGSILQVRTCQPTYVVWQYTNNQGSLNNDYKLLIDDSDSPLLSVEELTLVKNKKEFEEACRMLSTPAQNFVEVDFRNEFFLKNGQSVKLLLKFLTYRTPSSEKSIEAHSITLHLLRNTIPCAEKRLFVEPSHPDIHEVLIFYRLVEGIVEVELDEEWSVRYSQNFVVSVLHGSVCKWFKNRLVISLNCDGPGLREFLLVVYQDKSRLNVLKISKVLLYLYEGVRKTLKLGESFSHDLKLRSDKLKVVRMESSHPNLVTFHPPIASVSSAETSHSLLVFPQDPGLLTIVATAVQHDSNQLMAAFVLMLEVQPLENMQQLQHTVSPYTYVRNELRIDNPHDRQCEFQVRCTSPRVLLPQSVLLEADSSVSVRIQIPPQLNSSFFSCYIFVYGDRQLLANCFHLSVYYK